MWSLFLGGRGGRNQASKLLVCFSVCSAGFYRSGPVCTMCPGNEIKAMAGDALDCSADPPCDNVSQEPNDQHTECGLYFYQYLKQLMTQ